MAGKPTLDWLDKLVALKAQLEKTPSAKRADLAKVLNFSETFVVYLLTLHPILDQAAIEKIRLASQGSAPFTLSFKSAQAFSGLKGKVPNPIATGHEILDQALSHHFTRRHILAMIDHIASGKPAKDFDHKKVRNKRSKKPSLPIVTPPPQATAVEEKKTPDTPGQGKGTNKLEEKSDLGEVIGGFLVLIFLIWLAVKLFHWISGLYHHLFS
jgi:hypothetical protein